MYVCVCVVCRYVCMYDVGWLVGWLVGRQGGGLVAGRSPEVSRSGHTYIHAHLHTSRVLQTASWHSFNDP